MSFCNNTSFCQQVEFTAIVVSPLFHTNMQKTIRKVKIVHKSFCPAKSPILEDIPYSLVPAQALARIVGVPTPYIDVVIALAHNMLPGEIDEGRTAEALGIAGMTKDEVLALVNG